MVVGILFNTGDAFHILVHHLAAASGLLQLPSHPRSLQYYYK